MAQADIAEAISNLRNAVDVLKQSPELLHAPEMDFFKDYLQSLGGKIPPLHSKPSAPPPKVKPPPLHHRPSYSPRQ